MDNTSWVYLDWIMYDIVTILIIYAFHKVKSVEFSTAAYYVFFGLTINTLLFAGMLFDTIALDEKEPWFFWYLYTFTVNTVDIIMISVLILNRDFLLLKRLKFLYKNE
ncbi:hypothetical protein [Pseudoalteromonas citrea]|nr:hypothetical protein [Pseudoalteromonas citrea]